MTFANDPACQAVELRALLGNAGLASLRLGGRTLLPIALRRDLFTPVSTFDIKNLDTLVALLEVDSNS